MWTHEDHGELHTEGDLSPSSNWGFWSCEAATVRYLRSNLDLLDITLVFESTLVPL